MDDLAMQAAAATPDPLAVAGVELCTASSEMPLRLSTTEAPTR
jgi:hypothetical protein